MSDTGESQTSDPFAKALKLWRLLDFDKRENVYWLIALRVVCTLMLSFRDALHPDQIF